MVNRAILVGNLGKDPEFKTLENGNSLVKFSMATSESYKNKDGEYVKKTEWHNCVMFGKRAEVISKYVKKGDPLYVEGKIETRSYDDKDGNKKYITEIVLNNFEFLGGSKNSDNNVSNKSEESVDAPPQEEDDLPF